MGKVLRSLGLVAGLGGMPLLAQALEVVHWGDAAPPAGLLGRPLQASAGLAGRITAAASQHDGGFRPVAAPALEPFPQPHRGPATGAAPSQSSGPALRRAAPDANDFEGGPLSGLLAGLGAVALLMWRRLRRG